MYSSMSKGSRKPPGRLRILEKVSKSTATDPQTLAHINLGVESASISAWRGWGSGVGLDGGFLTVAAQSTLQIANLS
jgi:hypothetical protein